MLRLCALLLCLALPTLAQTARAQTAPPETAHPKTALAAVAANFADTAKALAAQFQRETGQEVQITTGSTGKLYAQITQGAPFDLMLSADAEAPARLHEAGHGTPQPYATGILTLWVPGQPAGSPPAALLQDNSIRHIAIANPALAPYGKATVTALQAMGLDAALKDKIVMGQNIGQAFALVQSGAAEAGFIARSALPAQANGYVWDVTPSLYPPIRQDAILLQHGADNPAATAFLAFLGTPSARALIVQSGYGLP